jgi:hypothetical protein
MLRRGGYTATRTKKDANPKPVDIPVPTHAQELMRRGQHVLISGSRLMESSEEAFHQSASDAQSDDTSVGVVSL